MTTQQSRITQITALVTAVGAIIIAVAGLYYDNSKDQAAYEKMREFYEAVRKDAIRQNNDNEAG